MDAYARLALKTHTLFFKFPFVFPQWCNCFENSTATFSHRFPAFFSIFCVVFLTFVIRSGFRQRNASETYPGTD